MGEDILHPLTFATFWFSSLAVLRSELKHTVHNKYSMIIVLYVKHVYYKFESEISKVRK